MGNYKYLLAICRRPIHIESPPHHKQSNTGLITALEKKKWKLHTTNCSCHQYYLSLRVILSLLTRSLTIFTGLLWKLYGRDYLDLLQVEFAIIPLYNLYLIAEAMDDLSGDQRLLLEYAVGIS